MSTPTEHLDPVMYEILYQRLALALFEAKETVRHLSASTIVREAGEVAQVACVKEGTACLISAGLLVHVASVSRTIRYMWEQSYDKDIGFYEGDQFIANDSQIGGMHIPDMMVVSPFFYKGEHIGWLGNFTHIPEVGAIEPGGMCASATEFCHEGLRLPCVKIVEKSRVKRDIMKIMTSATRDPKTIEIDTRAKIAGNEKARQQLTKIIDEFGLDFYLKATQRMIEDAEASAREAIKGLRPGKYRARTYTDSVSVFEQKLRVVELCMELKDTGDMVISTNVVSPQAKGFNNSALPGIEGVLFCVLLWQIFYAGRWNAGMLGALRLDIPYGSMINADNSAAVGYAPIGIGMQVQGCLNEVLSRASYAVGQYEDMIAPCPPLNCPTVGGLDRFGRTYGAIITSCMAGGGGARYEADGQDCSVAQFNPWDDCGDVEAEEVGPVLMLSRRMRPDSGGLGKNRGGLGVQNIFTPHESPVTFIGLTGSGGYVSQAQGMFGGYPPPAGSLDIVRDSEVFERGKANLSLPFSLEELELAGGTKESVFPSAKSSPMNPGDLFCVQYWGGGGSGDPIERDPEAVATDLRNLRTHWETAEKIYCVKIDPKKTLIVDQEGTRKLREDRRKERLAQGVPGKEYVARMVRRRKENNLPEPVKGYFQEMTAYSEGFREQLKVEEEFANKKSENYDGQRVEGKEYSLTPYVNVAKSGDGRKFAVCSHCGKILCEASENFKLHCLIQDRDPAEIYTKNTAPRKDWMIFREFYCPGCGVQMEVEGTPVGTPIVNAYELA